MSDIDFILISQSDIVDHTTYSKLPLERIELFRELVYPRLVSFRGGFRSILDMINFFRSGRFYSEPSEERETEQLNIWKLPGFNSLHIPEFLARHGIAARVVNNFESDWDRFVELYDRGSTRPLVGISTTFHLSYAIVRKLVKRLRRLDPSMKIVLGGAFINERAVNGRIEDFETAMRRDRVNYVIHSFNSERDLVDLVRASAEGMPLDRVNNLVWFDGDDFERGPLRLNSVAWNEPVLDCPVLGESAGDNSFINRTIQLRTSSGCSYKCAFCSYPTTARGFHAMPMEHVEGQLENAAALGTIKQIVFIDDTINIPASRFRLLCRLMGRYEFEWFSFLRVQHLDEETASMMRESGCRAVYLGLESANDLVLHNMNKKATGQEFLRGIEMLRRHDITSLAAFVIGFPGETDQTIEENISFIESAGLDFYTLKEFYYLEHTPVHRMRAEYGLVGSGNAWKHDTMSFETARQKKIEMFRRIENSVFIDPDTSLWQLAYLCEQGFSIEEIRLMQAAMNAVVTDQLDGSFDDDHPAWSALRDVLAAEEKVR